MGERSRATLGARYPAPLSTAADEPPTVYLEPRECSSAIDIIATIIVVIGFAIDDTNASSIDITIEIIIIIIVIILPASFSDFDLG